MSRTNPILIIVSLIVLSINPSFADWRENAKAIDISGGEDHTLVLTANKWPWACGPNGGPGPYYGVLGTGNTSAALIAKTLVRVWDGTMNTPSDYLEDISDIDAGWKHSLALDVNTYVWSWGDNEQGELGVGEGTSASSTPIQVLRGEQTPADPNNPDPNLARIVDISAGRSGEHSLAVDANGFVYAWGRNQEGQCGVGLSGTGFRELDPNQVLRGEQPFDPNRPSVYLNRIIAVSAGEWHSMALEAYDPYDPNLDGRRLYLG
jgi:alpha-tubulin suppressor-like RCC1 family protein